MKATYAGSFQDGLTREDLRASFDELWRELDKLEQAAGKFEDGSDKVRLDCCGELAELESVDFIELGESEVGTALIEFVCPRCDELHESPAFR